MEAYQEEQTEVPTATQYKSVDDIRAEIIAASTRDIQADIDRSFIEMYDRIIRYTPLEFNSLQLALEFIKTNVK